LEVLLHKETEVKPHDQQEEEVRVLLVDDHTAIREALASIFEGEGFTLVGQAGSLAEAQKC
jgi:two-component system, NarL family, response regulator DevR